MFHEGSSSWGDFDNPEAFENDNNVRKKTSSTTLNIFGVTLGFHSNNISCLCFLFSSRELLGINPLLLSLLHHIRDNNNFFNLHRSHGSPCPPISSFFFPLGTISKPRRE